MSHANKPISHALTSFLYNGSIYIRCIPAKSLFNSTLVHEVVNRGDIFALQLPSHKLTIVPGTAMVTHLTADYQLLQPLPQEQLSLDI